VAEKNLANVQGESQGRRPAPDEAFVIGKQLPGAPAKRLTKLLGDPRVPTPPFSKSRALAIAVYEVQWKRALEQSSQHVTRHRTWDEIATNNNGVCLGAANVGQDRLEGGKISVNVEQCSDSHLQGLD
jgi:hypothetical protein